MSTLIVKTPAKRFQEELGRAAPFISLAVVVLEDTTEGRVFRLLLDNQAFTPEGMKGSEIERDTGLTQSVVSNALRKLRAKNITESRRQGQEIYNWIRPAVFKAVSAFKADDLEF